MLEFPKEPEPEGPEQRRVLRPRNPKGSGICNTARNFPVVATSPQKKQAHGSQSSERPPRCLKPSSTLNAATSHLNTHVPLPFITSTEAKTDMTKPHMPFKHQVIVTPTQVKSNRNPESSSPTAPTSTRTWLFPSAATIQGDGADMGKPGQRVVTTEQQARATNSTGGPQSVSEKQPLVSVTLHLNMVTDVFCELLIASSR